jgi:histidinol-phosphatase (PHP family)
VSTAGLRKPAGDLYPSSSLLRMLVEAGVPLTTASDAHQIDQLGSGFDAMYAALRELGVDTIATYDRRQRRAVAIV